MSDETPDTVMPTVKIPAQPEVTMAGITHILAPTIMKCALGGWLITIPGRGVAGKSELSEAIAFIEDQAFEWFDEPRRTIPKFLEKPRDDIIDRAIEMPLPLRRRIPSMLNGFFASAAAFLGVRTLGY